MIERGCDAAPSPALVRRTGRRRWGPWTAPWPAIALALAGCAGSGGTPEPRWTVELLLPAGAEESRASAITQGRPVGFVSVDGLPRAIWWSEGGGDWTDLQPPGAYSTEVRALEGDVQVGTLLLPTLETQAVMWLGTAESMTNLNPPAGDTSNATGVSSGTQVGSARFGATTEAGLWTGTAESWVDLHPVGATLSTAVAVSGGRQVGYVVMDGDDRAAIWEGTPGSWFDLHALLPERFGASIALGVEVAVDRIHVVGYAYDGMADQNVAALWVYGPLP